MTGGPRVSVTVSAEFPSAHRLFRADRDDAWNEETYGPCSRPHGHGHNYVVDLTVSGPVRAESGFVVDARELDRILREEVVGPCAMRRLDVDVPFLAGVNPTAENLVAAFAGRLAPRLAPLRLEALVLHETPRNAATFLAEEE